MPKIKYWGEDAKAVHNWESIMQFTQINNLYNWKIYITS